MRTSKTPIDVNTLCIIKFCRWIYFDNETLLIIGKSSSRAKVGTYEVHQANCLPDRAQVGLSSITRATFKRQCSKKPPTAGIRTQTDGADGASGCTTVRLQVQFWSWFSHRLSFFCAAVLKVEKGALKQRGIQLWSENFAQVFRTKIRTCSKDASRVTNWTSWREGVHVCVCKCVSVPASACVCVQVRVGVQVRVCVRIQER